LEITNLEALFKPNICVSIHVIQPTNWASLTALLFFQILPFLVPLQPRSQPNKAVACRITRHSSRR
jgi:hypothetical protein